jgi:putative oxidoreductase
MKIVVFTYDSQPGWCGVWCSEPTPSPANFGKKLNPESIPFPRKGSQTLSVRMDAVSHCNGHKTQPDARRRDEGSDEVDTMSGTGTASQIPSTRATRRRALTIALWALQALLALMFTMAGFAKVSGSPAIVEMFATIGIGQWLRYVVGALEIAGAVGVLIPRLSGLAALGLIGLMAGATLTNVLVLSASPLLPVALMLVSALIAWDRWPPTRHLFTNREPGRLQ